MVAECKKIYLKNLGCQSRAIDMPRIESFFKLNGHEIVSSPESADYIILSTCGLERTIQHVCCSMISELNKLPAQLIVTGCFPAMVDQREVKKGKVRFVAPKDINELDNIFHDFQIKFASIPDANFVSSKFEWRAPTPKEASTALLRVGTGCNEFCTFCVTRVAVGRFLSKSLDVCLAEYKDLLEKGHRYFRLLSEDVGAYGTDIGSSFSELLERMLLIDSKYEGVEWEIQNLNPFWAIKLRFELKRILKTGRIVFINCPVQSGSDRILRLMNRRYKSKDVEEVLLDFQETWPSLRLCTHIIVGFPTETHDEFMESLEFVKKAHLTNTTVMCYSDNDITPAYKMLNKWDRELKLKRKLYADNFLKQMRKEQLQTLSPGY